jgi:hypothetical protein
VVSIDIKVRRDGQEIHEADTVADTTGTFTLGEDGKTHLTKLEITALEGEEITAEALRSYPLAIATSMATRALHETNAEEPTLYLAPRPGQPGEVVDWTQLQRPDGSDAWYRRFGRWFLAATTQTTAPAKFIAERTGYPVSAIHRWTKEARRRGFLPPDIRSRSNR